MTATPPFTAERRAQDKTTGERFDDIETRLLAGDGVMAQLKIDLAENTVATRLVADNTSEMVEFFSTMKSAFRVLNWIGKLAMPLGAIIGMCTAIWGVWVIFKNGGRP